MSQVQAQMDVGQQLGQYGPGMYQVSHKRVSSQTGERGEVRPVRLLRVCLHRPHVTGSFRDQSLNIKLVMILLDEVPVRLAKRFDSWNGFALSKYCTAKRTKSRVNQREC